MSNLVPIERVENRIFFIRGLKVMIDRDLAKLYRVKTKNLNKAVKRNLKRFPDDFMFQLTKEECDSLRFQIGTLKRGKHSKYLPYVFTEQGVAMLSSVLRSERAIQVNILIMRAFLRLRRILSTHKEVARKLNELEGRVGKLDSEVSAIFHALRKLMAEPEQRAKKIGFLK